jgi:hypothetical protein
MTDGRPNREAALEELLMLWIANSNPAFKPFHALFEDKGLKERTVYANVTAAFPGYFSTRPKMAPEIGSLYDALRAPMLASPDSLIGQLDYIRERWAPYLGDEHQANSAGRRCTARRGPRHLDALPPARPRRLPPRRADVGFDGL